MSDATDFSWQNAKAAHAVLLCDMERGAVSWQETSKIDQIRRVHAQKHSQNPKLWTKNFCLDKGKTLNHADKDCNWAKKPKNE